MSLIPFISFVPYCFLIVQCCTDKNCALHWGEALFCMSKARKKYGKNKNVVLGVLSLNFLLISLLVLAMDCLSVPFCLSIK